MSVQGSTYVPIFIYALVLLIAWLLPNILGGPLEQSRIPAFRIAACRVMLAVAAVVGIVSSFLEVSPMRAAVTSVCFGLVAHTLYLGWRHLIGREPPSGHGWH